jgi:UDP-N-acetylglucosamine diphosphorylase/glucosamine-1-phosphate N-acetyltransferase
MTAFHLYDDATARTFEPFALSRPCGELRAGAALIRERWTRATGMRCEGFVAAPHLAEFEEFDAPHATRDRVPAGAWLVNARCAPALGAAKLSDATGVIRVGGRVAAVRLATALNVSELVGGGRVLDTLASGAEVEIAGWWLDEVWDLIAFLPAMLALDCAALIPASGATPGALTVIGTGAAHVDASATIEPYVVADTTAGPVVVLAGATVQSFTRLVGPCVIGEGATIVSGRISGCSIGPKAKICGEISVSIVIGHANKGHDGFVGHSVIGRWANLGAGTITSNLKNSYGEVAMWTPTGVRGTGLQFLGALIGDHAKLGIGTRLTTGCVVGAGANVFGTRMPPKAIPPFAWGDGAPWETFALDRFLAVAERVMIRRSVAMTDAMRTQWSAAFAARWAT